jgi:thioredoxin-related protein
MIKRISFDLIKIAMFNFTVEINNFKREIMKKAIFILLFFINICALRAQELVWRNNFNEALQISEQTKKPLMLFFTGSDWCGWCMRLQNEVFKKPEFATWANEHVVLVEVDFPRRSTLSPEIQAQNKKLQEFFEIGGYPTVWFVSANKDKDKILFNRIGSTGYIAGGPGVWLSNANEILKQKQ